mmetsp:Transcript_13380/g.46858  ORF Transcript_13380/g.46858 Transcript_13380/m.46858 type:complete len:231 (+) Transcript_13380:1499-2191(+)
MAPSNFAAASGAPKSTKVPRCDGSFAIWSTKPGPLCRMPGVPQAAASWAVLPNVSKSDALTSQSAAAYTAASAGPRATMPRSTTTRGGSCHLSTSAATASSAASPMIVSVQPCADAWRQRTRRLMRFSALHRPTYAATRQSSPTAQPPSSFARASATAFADGAAETRSSQEMGPYQSTRPAGQTPRSTRTRAKLGDVVTTRAASRDVTACDSDASAGTPPGSFDPSVWSE